MTTNFAEQFGKFIDVCQCIKTFQSSCIFFKNETKTWQRNCLTNYLWCSVIVCFSKLCCQMFDLFFIFSALFLRIESREYGFLMSCSQNVQDSSWQSEYYGMRSRISFGNHLIFFQNLTQYIITHWPWNFEKNLWSGSVYIKLSTKVFKKIS